MSGPARLWALLPGRTRRALSGLALISIVSALAEFATFAALAVLLRRIAAPSSSLARAAALFALFALVSSALRWWLQRRTARLSADAAHELAVEAKRRLLDQPLPFHHRFHSASAAATLEKVRTLAAGVLLPLVRLSQSLVIGTALVAASLLLLPPLALAALAGLAAIYAAVAMMGARATRRREVGFAPLFDDRARLVQESFTGIRHVIIDRLGADRVARFARIDSDIQSRIADFQSLAATPRLVVEGVGMATLAIVVAILASRGGNVAISAAGLTAFAAMRLLPLASSAYGGWQGWTAHRGVIDDVAATLSLPIAPDVTGPPIPFEQAIELRDVAFRYDGTDAPLFSNLSLHLPKASRTAIAGVTGVGKSTVADLCMGLLQPSSGALLVDGKPIDAASAPGWRANVAHVDQTLFLIDGTVLENVATGAAVDRERARSALMQAALPELAEDLDRQVGEAGVRLSGGQRQRLALARAYYKGAAFLVLDEATNALDEATEAAVLGAIPDHVTLLVISHRPATLAWCDRTLTLEDGRLVDRAPVRATNSPPARDRDRATSP